MGQLKIFISSTCYDLKKIRSELFEFLLSQGHAPVLSEYPNFPVDPRKDIINNCIENVKRSTDIFVLIIGNRYGYQIDNNKSITNTEYMCAKELGIPTYVFISKSITSLYTLWEKDKERDYSESVDSNKIFEFVSEIRESKNNWCFEFDSSHEIIDTLRVQFSHLFRIALEQFTKFNNNIPDIYNELSKASINILLNKGSMYEALFFAQTLEDELARYEDSKFDMEFNILLGSKNRIDNLPELQKWLQQNITSVKLFSTSASNLMNRVFPKFYGEPGVPSDIKGLYYVSKRLSRLYFELIKWSSDVQSTSVDESFIQLRDSFAQYTIKSAEQIWFFPQRIKSDITNGLERQRNGEKDIYIKTILVMEVDKDSTTDFECEMEKLLKANK